MVEYLFPEVATVVLFLIAIIGMAVLVYISTQWE